MQECRRKTASPAVNSYIYQLVNEYYSGSGRGYRIPGDQSMQECGTHTSITMQVFAVYILTVGGWDVAIGRRQKKRQKSQLVLTAGMQALRMLEQRVCKPNNSQLLELVQANPLLRHRRHRHPSHRAIIYIYYIKLYNKKYTILQQSYLINIMKQGWRPEPYLVGAGAADRTGRHLAEGGIYFFLSILIIICVQCLFVH